jgi:pteridine reductase
MGLKGKNILVSGAARRLGKLFALTAARQGANIFLHYGHSRDEAFEVAKEIEAMGVKAWLLEADLQDPAQAINLVEQATKTAPIFAIVNSAAIFETLSLEDTRLEDWQRNLNINLTAPFLISQAFAKQFVFEGQAGRIVNILDWRALRPGKDHFPYTISKAGLAALTSSLAHALAPNINVNGLALGAILPPVTGVDEQELLKNVPAKRWATLDEVSQGLLFLLEGPEYVTGEIIHIDGGRHLV